MTARGASVIPEIAFDDIEAGRVDAGKRQAVKRRGCAIVRGTSPRGQVEAWNEELGDYLRRNDYYDTGSEAPADDDFSTLDADHETDYEGRATPDDLTPLGRRQMGIDEW
jgi:hypothetical protein